MATPNTVSGANKPEKEGFYTTDPIVQQATIADIANDANGTAIATAVNALILRLKNLGLIASA